MLARLGFSAVVLVSAFPLFATHAEPLPLEQIQETIRILQHVESGDFVLARFTGTWSSQKPSGIDVNEKAVKDFSFIDPDDLLTLKASLNFQPGLHSLQLGEANLWFYLPDSGEDARIVLPQLLFGSKWRLFCIWNKQNRPLHPADLTRCAASPKQASQTVLLPSGLTVSPLSPESPSEPAVVQEEPVYHQAKFWVLILTGVCLALVILLLVPRSSLEVNQSDAPDQPETVTVDDPPTGWSLHHSPEAHSIWLEFESYEILCLSEKGKGVPWKTVKAQLQGGMASIRGFIQYSQRKDFKLDYIHLLFSSILEKPYGISFALIRLGKDPLVEFFGPKNWEPRLKSGGPTVLSEAASMPREGHIPWKSYLHPGDTLLVSHLDLELKRRGNQ